MIHLGEKVADVEEPNKEDTDQSASLSKPSDNPLSLSLFVNTDDVQDDLDEDLKEIEREKVSLIFGVNCSVKNSVHGLW